MYGNNVPAEVFSCENLARGRVLLDCEAADAVGSVEAIEVIIDKSQETLGAEHYWVSVDTSDRPAYKFGDAKRKQAVSKVRMKVNAVLRDTCGWISSNKCQWSVIIPCRC